ncbi:MAG TPA: response regulator [Patescibacteria group bacterium]
MNKLLIVEDDVLLDEAYRRKFGSIYDVRIAVDGEGGIKTAISWEPDLILLDIYLPGRLNGLDVLQAIRKERKLEKTPVLVITNLPDAIERVMAMGATKCYMKTDVDLNGIETDIDELLAKQEK